MGRKCHYEVLGVESTANNEDLKKAYKKCALRWHPDKNIGDENAHEQFLLVKEAYTVLSDPHERAWYDKHKDQILSEGTEEVNFFDVFRYFSTSCFSGYGDDENGFFTVYRGVFQNIIEEDKAVSGLSNLVAPTFGQSDSDFVEIVEPFYNYWSQYCTKITFAWVDEKINREYGRKAVKFIQKENLKKREKLRKERNEEIRNLVAFIKKRDKRVSAWRQKMESEKLEKAQKAEILRQEQLKERQRLNESYQESDWSKFSKIENELEHLEKSLNERFSDSDSSDLDSCSENSEEEPPKVKSLYCVACKKLFQSEKAFANHEGSKKHKQNVAQISDTNE